MLERLVSSRTGLPKFCSMLLEQTHDKGYNNRFSARYVLCEEG